MNLVSLLLYRAGNPNGDQVFTVGQESGKARAGAVSAAPAPGSDAAHTPHPPRHTQRTRGTAHGQQLRHHQSYRQKSTTNRKLREMVK